VYDHIIKTILQHILQSDKANELSSALAHVMAYAEYNTISEELLETISQICTKHPQLVGNYCPL
jgi:hypothetical protein